MPVTGLPAWKRGQPGQVGNEAAPTVVTSAGVRLVTFPLHDAPATLRGRPDGASSYRARPPACVPSGSPPPDRLVSLAALFVLVLAILIAVVLWALFGGRK